MEKTNKLQVSIDGKTFAIHGTESNEYLLTLSEYIDKKILEARNAKPITTFNIDLNVLYILLNIADDLFKEKGKNADIFQMLTLKKHELEEYINEFERLSRENDLLKEKLYDSQLNLGALKKDLADYKDLFDNIK